MHNLEGVTLSLLPKVSWREQMPTCHERCGLLSTAPGLASTQGALTVGQTIEEQKSLWPQSLPRVKAKTKE